MKRLVKMLSRIITVGIVVMVYFNPTTNAQDAKTIFYYKAELDDRLQKPKAYKKSDEIHQNIRIPDLISDLSLKVDKSDSTNNDCIWSGPRGINYLRIDVDGEHNLLFPENIPASSIVMVGLSQPKEFINRGKTYFMDVTFYGFKVIDDPRQR